MKIATRILSVTLICLLSIGCTYPTTKVSRVENRPTIVIVGASGTATIEVDGINLGLAQQYNGEPRSLLVESGRHEVKIVDQNVVLLNREVFVSDGETRSLTLKRN